MMRNDYLSHHGVLGQKWGVRRFQNADGSLTPRGRARAQKEYSSYTSTYHGKKGDYTLQKHDKKTEKAMTLKTKRPVTASQGNKINRYQTTSIKGKNGLQTDLTVDYKTGAVVAKSLNKYKGQTLQWTKKVNDISEDEYKLGEQEVRKFWDEFM